VRWPLLALLALLPLGLALVRGSETVTAVAATLALVGAVLTLSAADAVARRGRTAEYRARWDLPDFLDTRVAAASFLTISAESCEERRDDEDGRWERWDRWGEGGDGIRRRLEVMVVLNFWEEVASAYNHDLLDRSWFRTDLAWQLSHNWERAEWFIRRYRTEAEDADFFCEWQTAIQALCFDLKQQADAAQRRALSVGPGDDILYVRRD